LGFIVIFCIYCWVLLRFIVICCITSGVGRSNSCVRSHLRRSPGPIRLSRGLFRRAGKIYAARGPFPSPSTRPSPPAHTHIHTYGGGGVWLELIRHNIHTYIHTHTHIPLTLSSGSNRVIQQITIKHNKSQ
jgi:hypothetical protein